MWSWEKYFVVLRQTLPMCMLMALTFFLGLFTHHKYLLLVSFTLAIVINFFAYQSIVGSNDE